jgi:hypothetical protein
MSKPAESIPGHRGPAYLNLAKKVHAELWHGISDTGRSDIDKKDSPTTGN